MSRFFFLSQFAFYSLKFSNVEKSSRKFVNDPEFISCWLKCVPPVCCGRLLSLATALIEFEQLVVLFPQLLRCVYSIPSVLGHVHRAVFHNQKCSHFELKHLSLDFRLLSSKHFVNVVKAEDAADFQTLLEVHRVPKNCCSVDDVDLFDYCWIDLSLVVVGN